MKSSTKTFIVTIVLVLILMGVYAYLHYIIAVKANTLQVSLQTIASEQALSKEQRTIATLLEETAEEREALNAYVVDGDQGTITLLSELEQMAMRLGVETGDVDLSITPMDSGSYDALQVSLTFVGAEAAVLQMLTQLELLPYASVVTGLRYTRSYEGETAAASLQGSVSLVASIINI